MSGDSDCVISEPSKRTVPAEARHRPRMVRSVVVLPAPLRPSSMVSSPRGTQAAWNPSSTRCVIADAPDNGGPVTWLVSKGEFGEWVSRKIDPFSVIEKAYYKTDKPPRHPLRPAFSKIEWITDTKVRFRSHCNSGTYLLTVDVTALKKPPETQKISDDPRFQE